MFLEGDGFDVCWDIDDWDGGEEISGGEDVIFL